MDIFTISLLNGISYGLLLFMLSSGLTLIFSMMGVLNFAHASFYMLGAYFAYTTAQLVGYWPALLIGRVSRYWQDRHSDWLSLGISIYDPARRGEGIGFEALGLWTDYLFASFPEISRLDLRTWSGNIGMMRLAEKLGYLREGCFRDARRVGGLHYDALAYGILRREWEERRERG